jgi:hypothetical protein
MADFDNGLPPDSTYVSGNSINSVSIATGELIESEGGQITGMLVATGELIESEGGRVTGVVIDKEKTGKSCMFYL